MKRDDQNATRFCHFVLENSIRLIRAIRGEFSCSFSSANSAVENHRQSFRRPGLVPAFVVWELDAIQPAELALHVYASCAVVPRLGRSGATCFDSFIQYKSLGG